MKKTRTIAVTLALICAMALGAAAAVTVQRITADLRPDISVTVDGKKQDLLSQDGAAVSPITYNGTTYLPVRALSEALGLDVAWDQNTQSVILTTPKTAGTQPPVTSSQPTGDTAKGFETRINALSDRVTAIEKATTFDRSAYRTLDRDIDSLDDELELAYEGGKLTREEYRTLDDKLDLADDRLDKAEDRWEDD